MTAHLAVIEISVYTSGLTHAKFITVCDIKVVVVKAEENFLHICLVSRIIMHPKALCQ